jgi:hypothetical protein
MLFFDLFQITKIYTYQYQLYLQSQNQTTLDMQATGTWIVLKDPRKLKKPSDIILLDSTKESMSIDSDAIPTNILEVLSVGELVRDTQLKDSVGKKVIVDPRMPPCLVALEDKKDKDDFVEMVIVVQENQILMVI